MEIDQGAVAPPQGPVGGRSRIVRPRGPNREESLIQRVQIAAALPQVEQLGTGQRAHVQVVTAESVGSCASVTPVSRSNPSCSSLMCSTAMAFALASRSGIAWYSDTQQR